MLSDNGPEFTSRNHLSRHPFERMWKLGVQHCYTRPVSPANQRQSGALLADANEDLIDSTTFENVEEFKRELAEYLLCYNELQPHQGIHIKTP